MMVPVSDAILIAVATGIVSGLISWGGIHAELRSLRRDVERAQKTADDAHRRLNLLLSEHHGGRRNYDPK